MSRNEKHFKMSYKTFYKKGIKKLIGLECRLPENN